MAARALADATSSRTHPRARRRVHLPETVVSDRFPRTRVMARTSSSRSERSSARIRLTLGAPGRRASSNPLGWMADVRSRPSSLSRGRPLGPTHRLCHIPTARRPTLLTAGVVGAPAHPAHLRGQDPSIAAPIAISHASRIPRRREVRREFDPFAVGLCEAVEIGEQDFVAVSEYGGPG